MQIAGLEVLRIINEPTAGRAWNPASYAFRSLTKEDLVQIVDIQMRHLRDLLAERHIKLEMDGAVRQHLAEMGYDPVYGARPLKRVIQREVQDPLALALLEGEFREGDTVQVDTHDGQLVFERAEATLPKT